MRITINVLLNIDLYLTLDYLTNIVIYIQDQTGHIDLRDYVVDLCLVSGPATIEEVLKMAFEVRNFF